MKEIQGEFKQTGLTYTCSFTEEQVFFTVDHVRRGRDGIVAEFTVFTFRPDYDPHINWGIVVIADLRSREQFWQSCKRLMPMSVGGGVLDWERLLNFVCRNVVMSERADSQIKLLDLTKDYSSPPWLVKDILYKGEPTVFFGDGGSGKSRLGHATALSVMTGKEIVPGFEPKETGPVLYWDWEATEQRLTERTLALCSGAGITPIPPFYKHGEIPLRDCVEDVAEFCKSEGVVLIVIDSMEMSMGGTKENGGDANDAAIKLYLGLRTIGIASLLIDHVPTSELNNAKARRQYGSIYKKNLARNVFEIRTASDTPDKNKCFHIGVFNHKKNDGAFIPDMGFRVEWDENKTSYHTESLMESDIAERLTTNQLIERVLRESSTRLTSNQIRAYTGLSESKIVPAVSKLLHKKTLDHVGKTYGWVGVNYEK